MKRLLSLWILVMGSAYAETVHPTLIGGRVADPRDFPASVWTQTCSATVVGERSVFIAAHCVSGNPTIQFVVGPNRYSATCALSRDYAGNSTADYAMCQTNAVVVGIPYENLNLDPSRIVVGGTVLLSGYGCTQAGGTGGNDGIYRIGEARISRLPVGTDNDIITSNGAALCYGDSGGPAFVTERGGARYVISTNSRGDISRTSYLSAIHTAQGRRFLQAWSQMSGQKICGYHSDARGCRNGSAQPLPGTGEIAVDRSWIQLRGKLSVGYEGYADSVQRALADAIDSF